MPTAKLSEVDIYYEEHGSGAPLLLVPPSWWPCDTWKVVVVPFLSPHYRTISFDPRGTGRSGHPHHGYTITQFARDSIELLQQLGISRCHAVGFALGGEIAQAMAIERPDIVATLTMAATGPGSKSLHGGRREASDDKEIQQLGFERFIRSHLENDTTAFGPTFFREHPDVVAALGQALWARQTSPEDIRYHHDARRTWDTLGNAPRVQVPTLILVGGDDVVERGGSTPRATGERLAQLVPGAELAVVPEVRHMVFWDGTGALTALLDFLRRQTVNNK
jgi:pimeloyl-ACP methyl ester carboxylesterase